MTEDTKQELGREAFYAPVQTYVSFEALMASA